ncbi:hypothetical protein FDG94_gp034 [Pseudomonas phage SM1]|uniref:Uncharacterized protein n=2 Tax=Samunavirus TaxID=2560221 RepID=A0A0U3CPF2_9CAUD|nr:hypothetical protein FDG94_gp034 [Pseudomonas phage SM1]UGC97120.1 holin [Pseudomonas phage BHU-1]UGV19921.1 holin [Pseudomonas phage Pa BHU-15]UIW13639.1 holin [Pseudomonas phage Pa BHU-17]WDS62537.1 holin [Pseudomonas phage UF_RH6]ALT58027.1 hypothetical protein SM1_034 [Pseudomonas phage SM1]
MKVTAHEARRYAEVVADLTRRDDLYFSEYVEVTSVLARFWPEFLTMAELATLTFILGRTLMFRKKAESISKAHFLNGVIAADGTRVCSGVGVSHNTLRTALEGLVDKGIVDIHAFLDGKTETISRVYEVKTAKIVADRDTEGVRSMLIRSRKTMEKQPDRDGFEESGRGSKIWHTPLQNLAHNKEILRISKTSSKEDVSGSGEKVVERAFKLPMAKRVRRASVCTEPTTMSARERAEQILGAAKAKRNDRAVNTKVPTKKWETRTLQALLDKARESVGTSCPRITVVSKGIGVLHRRMLESEVEDVVDFFSWALTNWTLVASANRKAKATQLRNKATKAAQSEMHMAPNFSDLAYRFPYFFRFYQDRCYTEKQLASELKAKQEKIQTAKRKESEASIARRNEVRRRDEEAERQRRREEEAFRKRRAVMAQDSDDDLPEYEAPAWGG